jgi:sulfate transport system ATP-binding protein
MDIHVRDIVRDFGNTAALEGVSLDIASGELVALLGPSGSGKTTLLRIIAGLDVPTSGQVFFGDEDASATPVQDRKVGFVFQQYALFRHMTVLDNIGFGLSVRDRATRPASGEIRRRALELLDLVQLTGLEKRYPGQLSGGQRQRVALARALAVEPHVLLLDEPFGALDAKVRKDLRRWLREIHDRTGHTTVFVTHDQDEALELADRVAVLNKGRIEQVGTPDAVYDEPASSFVFRFIGESHAVPVAIREGRVWLGPHPVMLNLPGMADGPGHLHLRPHDVEFAAHAADALPARILSVRRSGATRRAEILIPGTGAGFEIDAPAALTVRPGDERPVRILRGRVFPDLA